MHNTQILVIAPESETTASRRRLFNQLLVSTRAGTLRVASKLLADLLLDQLLGTPLRSGAEKKLGEISLLARARPTHNLLLSSRQLSSHSTGSHKSESIANEAKKLPAVGACTTGTVDCMTCAFTADCSDTVVSGLQRFIGHFKASSDDTGVRLFQLNY